MFGAPKVAQSSIVWGIEIFNVDQSGLENEPLTEDDAYGPANRMGIAEVIVRVVLGKPTDGPVSYVGRFHLRFLGYFQRLTAGAIKYVLREPVYLILGNIEFYPGPEF